jgi:hypothetical protein
MNILLLPIHPSLIREAALSSLHPSSFILHPF